MNVDNYKAYIKNSISYSNYIIEKYSLVFSPVPIILVAKGEGFKVFDVELSMKQKNYSSYIDINTKCIYINYEISLEKKRFSIAYQLGHWFMHKNLIQKSLKGSDSTYSTNGVINTEANIFATTLLIPTKALKMKLNYYKQIRYPEKIISKDFLVTESIVHFKLSLLNDIKEIENLANRYDIDNQSHNDDIDPSSNKLLININNNQKKEIINNLEKKITSKKERLNKLFNNLED